MNERQAIEVFHLLFLRALSARVDPALYVLKGGCNLRFFFKSIRYSEDIDLDVRTIAVPTLTKNVDAVLAASAFARTLRSQRMTLGNVAAPKQTQTTQRWKVQIRLDDFAQDIPTKIEFSRRRFSPDLIHEPVDSDIVCIPSWYSTMRFRRPSLRKSKHLPCATKPRLAIFSI